MAWPGMAPPPAGRGGVSRHAHGDDGVGANTCGQNGVDVCVGGVSQGMQVLGIWPAKGQNDMRDRVKQCRQQYCMCLA